MLATVDELIRYMSGVNLDDQQRADAMQSLQAVQRELERRLNRPLEPVLVQERVQATEGGYLTFSVTPVWQIVSLVDQNGYSLPVHGWNNNIPTVTALAADAYKTYTGQGVYRQVDLAPGNFYGVSPLDYGNFRVGAPSSWFVMQYIGGLITWDDTDLKEAILAKAALRMTRRHDDTLSLKGGIFRDDTDNQSSAEMGENWTDDEVRSFARYRRRVVV